MTASRWPTRGGPIAEPPAAGRRARGRDVTAACAFALLLLALAWQLAAPPAPPLYDGLALGNEPYRYVNRPPGHKATPPPLSAHGTVLLSGGVLAPFDIGTGEVFPQASIAASTNALVLPDGVTSATVTVKPVQPSTSAPHGYVYDGNVYRITATAGGRSVPLARDATVRIALRGTGKKGTASLALYASKRWQVLPAPPSGVPGQYSAAVTSLGDAVLVVAASAANAKGGGSSGISTTPIVLAAVVVVLLSLFLLIRLARRRARTQEQQE